MDEYTDFFPQLALVAALLLTALAAAPFFERFHIPSPAAFLAVGIAAGLLDVGPAKDLSTASLEEIGAVALMVILFQGGLATGFGAWRRAAQPILLLGLLGTAATAAGLAVVGKLLLGFDWPIALLVGVALAPTDPAAVYAVLRGRSGSERPRTILEGESGFNDPVAISLMVAVTAGLATGDSNVTEGTARFVQELGIGVVAGAVGGLLLRAALRVTPRLEQGVQAIALLLGAVLLGSVTAAVHGSGFLAVYLAGLLLSDAWAGQDGTRHAVPEALSAAAEPLLFAMLGAVFAPLVGGLDLARGLALTFVTVFVLRPLVASVCLVGSRLRAPERVLVSWGGLKGAVPLLLAAYPALDDLDGATMVAATVLVATAASLLVQGVTLPRVVDRAR
ncbi:MAG TPA: cation:proton antiporter [Thermoleophilaceae bacterium]|nr:cation:proton antiporter [Thermoleophilaceae bacterium]